MDDMIAKSTVIVRAKVGAPKTALHGSIVYTHYTVYVAEQLKGASSSQMDVVVPGGRIGRIAQTFSGTPALVEGTEYVLFLWTGRSGLTHVIGLTQGVFHVNRNAQGQVVLSRTASTEPMLDPSTGREVADQAVSLRWSELARRVKELTSKE